MQKEYFCELDNISLQVIGIMPMTFLFSHVRLQEEFYLYAEQSFCIFVEYQLIFFVRQLHLQYIVNGLCCTRYRIIRGK